MRVQEGNHFRALVALGLAQQVVGNVLLEIFQHQGHAACAAAAACTHGDMRTRQRLPQAEQALRLFAWVGADCGLFGHQDHQAFARFLRSEAVAALSTSPAAVIATP